MNKPIDNQLITLSQQVLAQLNTIILGKPQAVKLALACLLARGHLLIEDVPGVGKTTLAHALAKVLGLQFNRIQFTSDLLPADILGVTVYKQDSGQFKFTPGPVFAQLVLADEVNRATPKTQSALLEAMEEGQVSIEGESHDLPSPFFVIATQNPSFQIGTFALPESQLDRFMMRVQLGYPDSDAERALLAGESRAELLARIEPVLSVVELERIQQAIDSVTTQEPLIDYVHALIQASRNLPGVSIGLSPRAGLAMIRAARAWALLNKRDFVIPQDVQDILPAIVTHRLQLDEGKQPAAMDKIVQQLLSVPIP